MGEDRKIHSEEDEAVPVHDASKVLPQKAPWHTPSFEEYPYSVTAAGVGLSADGLGYS